MAELGFNICMISRNKSKMEDKLKQIKETTLEKTGKKIQTMAIVADFAEMYTYADYEKALEPLLSIDVAMLFLNAGIAEPGPFS